MAQALLGRTKEMGVCVYGKVIGWPDTFGTCPETNPYTCKAKISQKNNEPNSPFVNDAGAIDCSPVAYSDEGRKLVGRKDNIFHSPEKR